MPYKVIDIFNDLPKTNCAEYGKPGCFQFATGVYIEGMPLSACPYLTPEKLEEMQGRLGQESILFLIEAFANRLNNRTIGEIVP